jgi:hypothetical protein
MNRSISDLRRAFNRTSEVTIADYAALIGAPKPKVRVNQIGVRGLRWTVVKVDDKSGEITIACLHPETKQIVTLQCEMSDLTIVRTDSENSVLFGAIPAGTKIAEGK